MTKQEAVSIIKAHIKSIRIPRGGCKTTALCLYLMALETLLEECK